MMQVQRKPIWLAPPISGRLITSGSSRLPESERKDLELPDRVRIQRTHPGPAGYSLVLEDDGTVLAGPSRKEVFLS